MKQFGQEYYDNLNKKWLIDELDEIIYISDIETYELIYLNKAGRELFNMDKLESGKCYKVLQGKDAPCDVCTNSKLCHEKLYVWEYTNQRIDKHFVVKDKLIDWNGRSVRLEFAIDVTNKENFSNDLQNKLSIESTIVKCISSLSEPISIKESVSTVLNTICDFYGAERGYIFEVDQINHTCNNTYEWCRDNVTPSIDTLQNLNMKELPLWAGILENKEPLIISELEEIKDSYPKEYEILKMQNVNSLFAVGFQGAVLGYVGVDNPTIHTDDISLLQNLKYFILNEISKNYRVDKLEHFAYHDSLTGVRNRNYYTDFEEKVMRNMSSLTFLGVGSIDINGLKSVNKDLGHKHGDSVVVETVGIILNEFNSENVFRISGDEFLIICCNMDNDEFVKKMLNIKNIFDENYIATIGYTWTHNPIDLQTLIDHADDIMLSNKQAYYSQVEKEQKHNPMHTKMLFDLFKANKFEIVLQPVVDANSGKIIGAEALSRLRHDDYGIIYPAKYIHILEKERTISHLDYYMFNKVCMQLQEWQDSGLALTMIAVNFSRITMLDSDFVKKLDKLYSNYTFPKKYLEIEITESVGEIEKEVLITISNKISKAGYRLALDDFGSKYTSMAILTSMQFDTLKIDISLIKDIVNVKKCRNIVKRILQICKDLSIISVAEGVETLEQKNILKKAGCSLLQGYFIDRPLTIDDFTIKYLQQKY